MFRGGTVECLGKLGGVEATARGELVARAGAADNGSRHGGAWDNVAAPIGLVLLSAGGGIVNEPLGAVRTELHAAVARHAEAQVGGRVLHQWLHALWVDARLVQHTPALDITKHAHVTSVLQPGIPPTATHSHSHSHTQPQPHTATHSHTQPHTHHV